MASLRLFSKPLSFTWLAAVPFLLVLGGCATDRSNLKIGQAETVQAVAPLTGKSVLVRNVRDARVFEEKPGNPSTPSMGFGDLASADAERLKKRAIGRKRNTFGQALGDVMLDEGQTVEGMVSKSIKDAFAESGYAIIDNPSLAKPETLIVDARIDRFWAWVKPGFWALTFSGDISTDLAVTTQTGERKLNTVVSSHAEQSRQTGVESNWIEIYDEALAIYRASLKSHISEIR